jgi:pimeloyl-ACP methyl ester carboxylesterase
MRKRIISTLTIFTILLTTLVAGFPTKASTMIIRASQGNTIPLQQLFSETNTFNCTVANTATNNLAFNLNARNSNTVMPAAQITVLTHGLGNHAGAWSNARRIVDKNGDGDRPFEYCPNSLISAIYNDVGGAYVYWAEMLSPQNGRPRLNLWDISKQKTINQLYQKNERVEEIEDISKHIIVVFQATEEASNGTNNQKYFEFNYAISRIVYDVKNANDGILPKLNLIGFSRGGITNMQYALDHPDMVCSLISLGTPYFGSTTARVFGELAFPGGSDGLTNILDHTIYHDYRNRWNGNYNRLYRDINVVAIDSYSSIHFLESSVLHDQSMFNDVQKALLYAAINTLSTAALTVATVATPSTIAVAALTAAIANIVTLILPDYHSNTAALASIVANEFGVNTEIWPPQVRVVWYNDICVPRSSQRGRSSVSGQAPYTGFSNHSRYFHALSGGAHFGRVSMDMPPVPHNLIARDPQTINWIVNSSGVNFAVVREVKTAQDLSDIRNRPGDIHLLKNDINLMNVPWVPIPTLTGHLIGNGRTISNLNIQIPNTQFSSNQNFGLFRAISGGSVRDVKFDSVVIFSPSRQSGSWVYAGAVAGFMNPNSLIDNVTLTNAHVEVLRSGATVGGLVGRANNSVIVNCTVIGLTHWSNSTMGGVVGTVVNSHVENCTVVDSVISIFMVSDGQRAVGGVIGVADRSTVVWSTVVNTIVGYRGFSGMNGSDVEPRMGLVVGTLDNGSIINALIIDSHLVDDPALRTIRWGLFNALSHNQRVFFGTGPEQSFGRRIGTVTAINIQRV